MRLSERVKWPPKCVLTFSDGRGKVWLQTTDRAYDLADRLMLSHPHSTRVVHLSVSTESEKWDHWTEENVGKVEEHIRYDLEFDGYSVRLRRLSKVSRTGPSACWVPFQWRLSIRPA